MKRIVISLSCILLLPLTGCLDESSSGSNRTIFRVDQNAKKEESARYGYGSKKEDRRKAARNKPSEDTIVKPENPDGSGNQSAVNDPTKTKVDPAVETTDTVAPPENTIPTEVVEKKEETPAPANTSSSGGGIPVAQMIPGKAGQVYSPFAPGKPCDVSGYPPGTVMECPYTGKEFKVP